MKGKNLTLLSVFSFRVWILQGNPLNWIKLVGYSAMLLCLPLTWLQCSIYIVWYIRTVHISKMILSTAIEICGKILSWMTSHPLVA
uniref:Uncharacterized protein n=1 Tax=Rhizophora mucronata TaxID=61149 RepID=A0A2P2P5J9_RHIMU